MPEGDVTGTAPHLVSDTLDLAAKQASDQCFARVARPGGGLRPYCLALFSWPTRRACSSGARCTAGFCQCTSKPSRFFVLPAATRMKGISSSAYSKRSPRPSSTTARSTTRSGRRGRVTQASGMAKGPDARTTRAGREWATHRRLTAYHSLAANEPWLTVAARDRGSDDGSGDSRGPLSLLSQAGPRKRLQLHPRGAAPAWPREPSDERKARRGPSSSTRANPFPGWSGTTSGPGRNMRWRSPCGSTLCLGASVLERLQRSRSRDRSSERTLLGDCMVTQRPCGRCSTTGRGQ